MKKFFISILIFTSTSFYTTASSAVVQKNEVPTPTISITNTVPKEPADSQEKPLKVKTTILTKKVEKKLKFEDTPTDSIKREKKRDIELPSDVDKILKEMDIDDIDPVTEAPQSPVEKIYDPVKKNFIWIAFSVILLPIILFTLLIKTMQLAKNRFEEEKKEGPSKEEQFLDEIEKAQKTTKKKHRSLAEILGHHPKEKHISSRSSKPTSKSNYEDDFDRDDEDFEFMVEEVVIIEEKDEPKSSQKQKPPKETAKKEAPIESPVELEQKEQPAQEPEPQSSGTIDSFEISETLKFVLTKKDDSTNLICKINDNEITVMQLEKAQKFNKVRKIDSKPGRDVYMVKLDSWRGLVEVKENSAKYLMDI